MSIDKVHKLFLSNKLLLFTIVASFIAVRLFSADSQLDNLSFWGSMIIQIWVAFFLLQLNNTFNIIQIRTFLPTIFYLLFIGINPIFYYDIKGSVAACCFVLCYQTLFASYQKPLSQINALNISLLLVLGSLLWPPLLFFFPVLWLGFRHFQCFNIKVFFASLSGFVIIYLFIFALSIFLGEKKLFLSLLPQANELFIFQKPYLSVLEWSTWGFLLLFYLIIGLYLFTFNISERIWTILILKYFYFSAFIGFFFFIFQNEYRSAWGLITAIPLAFMNGHFFSRSNNRWMQYLLLLFFLFFVGIGVAQLNI